MIVCMIDGNGVLKALIFAAVSTPVCIQLAGNCVINYLCRSQWPCGLRRKIASSRLLELRVRIPPGTFMSVSCECCLFLGSGLCVGLITCPEECGMSECGREA